MKKILLLFICLQILISCTSQNESRGVDEILKFYGGKVAWSIGFNTSTEEEELQGKFFEITLMDVEIGKYYPNASLPASNCAYLLYHSLTEEEKNKYAFIRVILQEGEKSSTYEFATRQLGIVEATMPTLNQVVEHMKDHNHEKVTALFNPVLKENSNLQEYKAELENYRKESLRVDSTYGTVKDFLLQGFIFHDEQINSEVKEVVRLSGNLLREKQHTDFSVTLDPALKDQNLYGLRFRQ